MAVVDDGLLEDVPLELLMGILRRRSGTARARRAAPPLKPSHFAPQGSRRAES
jgi:hypothetical protein